ncbi:MAG: ABC transporter permease [Nitrospirae bacterium]|nr:ABC transporter permease [Nitrospirota bacterium]
MRPLFFIAGVSAVLLAATLLRYSAANVIPVRLYRALVAWSLFLLLWEGTLYLGIFSSMLLASPSVIITKTLFLLEKGYLQANIIATLGRFLAGFSIALVMAVPAGIAFGLFGKAYEWLAPLLNFIRMIPAPALLPFAILVFGIGEGPAVFVIALGSFFPVFLNTVRGVREAERLHIEVIQTMGGNGMDVLRHVIVPSALPTILTGIRIGFGIGWLVLVSAEIVAADSGLGFMIEGARALLETPTVFVGMATICALGLAMDIFLKKIERFFILRRGGDLLTSQSNSTERNKPTICSEGRLWKWS